MGRPARGVLRLPQEDQTANTRREREQRCDHAHGQLIHHAAEYPGRAANHLPRLQSRVAVSISRAVRPPCLDVPERLTRTREGRFRPEARRITRRAKAMSELKEAKPKTIKLPGPDHPITIAPNANRVVVKIAGRIVADTRDAVILREASYAPVQYIPRKDVDMTSLERTDRVTYCPYKGDCAYYSIPASRAGPLHGLRGRPLLNRRCGSRLAADSGSHFRAV